MEEMKRKIIDVVEQYVEVDEDVPVDVVKDDVEFGTVYNIRGAGFESESGIRAGERSVHDWRAVCVRRRDVGRVAKGNGRRGKGGSLMCLSTCKREEEKSHATTRVTKRTHKTFVF